MVAPSLEYPSRLVYIKSGPRIGLRVVVTAILVLALLGVVLAPYWLPSLYLYLDVSSPPHRADVVVILGGGGTDRPETGAALFKQGYVSTVVVSGFDDEMQYAIDIVAANGVPADSIVVNDTATSTLNEAQQIFEILREIEVTSALIVTDATHTRRAQATYRHVFGDSEIELTFIAANNGMNASNWWLSKGASQVPMEYLKMIYYRIAYGVGSG